MPTTAGWRPNPLQAEAYLWRAIVYNSYRIDRDKCLKDVKKVVELAPELKKGVIVGSGGDFWEDPEFRRLLE